MHCPWLHFFLLFLFVVSLHLHHTLWRTSRGIIPASVVSKWHRKLKDPPYLSPLLFSVNYYDSFISSPSHLVLSAIRIPVQWCPPTVQRSRKSFCLSRWRYKNPNRFLFGLLLFYQTSSVVSLPGTNYALIQEPSMDTFRQQSLQRTVISQTTSPFDVESHSIALDANNVQPETSLCWEPLCFISDTDSTSFVIYTGSNRVIVKGAKLLHGFQACSGGVKGVGGNPVSILGKGSCRINLRADNDSSDSIDMHGAVYVPTSPFNLLPPQQFFSNLKKSNYEVEWFKNNDRR